MLKSLKLAIYNCYCTFPSIVLTNQSWIISNFNDTNEVYRVYIRVFTWTLTY